MLIHPNDVRRVILHEIAGHYGLHTLVGKDDDVVKEFDIIVSKLRGVSAASLQT